MSNVLVLRKANGQGQSPQQNIITPQINQQGAGWQMNLPGGQGVTGWGRAIPAMGAAWGALNALSSDDQGDLFSTIGNAGMRGYTGYQAASQALGPAQRYAHQLRGAGWNPRVLAARQGLANAPLAPPPPAMINPALPHNVNASGNLQVPSAPNLGNYFQQPLTSQSFTNFADSTAAGSAVDDTAAEDEYERITAKESDGGAGVPTDPPLNAQSPRQRTVNLLSEGVKESDKPSMIAGQESVDAVQQAIDNQHVATGEKIMGASAQGGLTAEEAKKKVVKSRRPWSYY